jgi:hypothetical protein
LIIATSLDVTASAIDGISRAIGGISGWRKRRKAQVREKPEWVSGINGIP